MTEIHKGLEDSTFKEPENIVHATVCRTSGLLATDKCSNTYSEIFVKDHLPDTCDAHQSQYTVCKESGKLANEFCPSTERKSANYAVEKERLGLWSTPGINSTMGVAPTEYCTIHKKTEVVAPTQPETPTEEPDDNTNEKPNDGENEKPTNPGTDPTEPEKPDKPGSGDTGDTGGGNTNGGNGSGNNTENNT